MFEYRSSFLNAKATPSKGDVVLYVRHCDILNASGLISVVVSVVVAALLVFAMGGGRSAPLASAWLCCLMGLMAVRLLVWRDWRRRPQPDLASVQRFLRRYRLLVGLSGALWGTTPWLLGQGADLTREVILAFALAGISAGGVTALAIDSTCVIAFLVPSVLPLILRFLCADDQIREVMGAMSLLYLCFMAVSAVRVGRGLHDNLRLEHEAELRGQVLRESEDRLKRAQQVAQLGSFDWDLAAGVVRWSDQHYRLWGIEPTAGEASVRLFVQGVHPEDRVAVRSTVLEAARHGQGYDCVHRVCRPDGSEIHVQERAEVVKDAQGKVVRIIGTVQDITARRAAEERIRHLAYYDPLTGLPNRHLLLERLQTTLQPGLASESHGALFFIDLDNFKNLNDTYGHDQGDALLRQVAERIGRCVRPGDMVARLGGDEFVVLLPKLGSDYPEATQPARRIAEDILVALQVPYALPARDYHSTSSIGVALFRTGRTEMEDLLKRADLAMYQAKAAGRDTICFFTPEMQAKATARAALEADLREAVRDGGFEIYLQGQVAADGRWIGAEALLRWPHPRRGMVPPGDLIPIAEESGLILPIGQWVLEQACQLLVAWADQPALAHLTLAVNVSARQFRQEGFVSEVLAALQRSGANPRRLKLELTESLLLSDVEEAIRKMSALRDHGVGFAIDDFGIGYSSLSYLKRLPLEQLKIDKTFVQDVLVDPNDAAIVHMILALGQNLGLQVIAEGVETEGQREFLSCGGCHGYQGFLFSCPVPAAIFAAGLSAVGGRDGRRAALA